MSYCGDHLEDYGIVYLQGPGKMSNMDVDCDGEQGGPEDDGRCDGSTTTIPETSVSYLIKEYDVGIADLNPHVHSFPVFGNSGTKPGWATFDPRTVGVEKASLMLVVCGDQMVTPPIIFPLTPFYGPHSKSAPESEEITARLTMSPLSVLWCMGRLQW